MVSKGGRHCAGDFTKATADVHLAPGTLLLFAPGEVHRGEVVTGAQTRSS